MRLVYSAWRIKCGFGVGLILRHIKLTCDRHLHRIEAKPVRFTLGPVDGDALAQRHGRSILIEDEIEAARAGALDRMRIACGDPERRMRALCRRRLDHNILEIPEAAFVRESLACRPRAQHDLDRFLEARFGFFRRDLETLELTVPISLANAEIEAAL